MKRQSQKRFLASSAAVVLGSVASFVDSDTYKKPPASSNTEENPDPLNQSPISDSLLHFSKDAFTPLFSPFMSRCDAGFFGWVRSGRQIPKYDEASHHKSLEEIYDVDWTNPLGEGGFGAVFAATNRSTSERVAVKKISKAYTNDAGFQR